jgi:hypothetical protein
MGRAPAGSCGELAGNRDQQKATRGETVAYGTPQADSTFKSLMPDGVDWSPRCQVRAEIPIRMLSGICCILLSISSEYCQL